MSKDSRQMHFIVSTPTNRGSWYQHRESTISLINSHVASLRTPSTAPREIQESHADDKIHYPASGFSTASQASPADAQAPTETRSSYRVGLSLHVLEEIFADTVSKVDESRNLEQAERLDNPLYRHPKQSIAQIPDGSNAPHPNSEPALPTGSSSSTIASTTRRTAISRAIRKLKPKNNASRASSKTTERSHTRLPAVYHRTDRSDVPKLAIHIGGSLDPFVSLSIEVSAGEKQLLQFFLTQGRQMLFGTSASPSYCPALTAFGQGALERSPVYVETHIVIAEYLFCKLQATQLSANFFRRRASAYRSVTGLMSKPDAKLDEQIFALICIHLAEHAIGRYDLQKLHLRAMHDLIQRKGGMQTFLQYRNAENSLIIPSFYSGQFMYVEFESSRHSLAAAGVTESFFTCLRRIRAWTLHHSTMADANRVQSRNFAADRAYNRQALHSLRAYLLAAINQGLRDPTTPYHHAAGAFYMLFSLCTTMSQFAFGFDTATKFLISLQSHMKKSVGDQSRETAVGDQFDAGGLRGLHPGVITFLIPQVARKIQNGQDEDDAAWRTVATEAQNYVIEVSIAEALVNAMKTFFLLSTTARLRISRGLLRSSMATTELTMGEAFSEEELEDMHLELRRTQP